MHATNLKLVYVYSCTHDIKEEDLYFYIKFLLSLLFLNLVLNKILKHQCCLFIFLIPLKKMFFSLSKYILKQGKFCHQVVQLN